MTSLIHKAGFESGVCKPADKHQPNGYYENVRMTQLLTSYLRHFDKQRQGKQFQPTDLDWDWPNFGSLMLDIVLDEMHGSRWVFKSTKLPICWRVVASHFPHARWLWVHRDEDDVIRSMQRTPFMDAYNDPQDWGDMVARYTVMREEMQDTVNHFASFDAGAIIRGDVFECKEVLHYIGLPDVDALTLMQRTVKADQWHCGKN